MKHTDHEKDVSDRTTRGEARLARLDELDDFEIAEGDPDIRGWSVVGTDGRSAGEVKELIVDTAAMKVRYMVVELDRQQAGAAGRQVLVPIGTARLDDDRDKVLLGEGILLASLPAYHRGELTREDERSLLGQYGGTAPSSKDDDFYAREHFEDRGFWGRRREGRDDSDYLVRSEEELDVDASEKRAGERELRVPLMAEEAVVEKRVVPKEDADLRKERIEVDKHGARGRSDGEERRPR